MENSKEIHNVITSKSLSYMLENKYTEMTLYIKSKQDIVSNYY
jgi:hypothetical protein